MITEELKPQKIEDIVSRSHEYLSVMRKMEDKGADLFFSLQEYIKEYFSKEKDDLKLKVMGVALTDMLYLKISILELRDTHTDLYFSSVIGLIFRELAKRNILLFFILDNSIRDDRFKLNTELYKAVNFNVVHPYIIEKLEYSQQHTKLPVKDYKSVETEIDEARKNKSHILYIEKDDSINYLENVLHLAEEFQGEYWCVFRNKGPAESQTATSLMGSFGDWLKMNGK